MEYAENIKMMNNTAASIFQQTKMFDKDPTEAKIDKLWKQVKNLHLMMMKQPRQAPKLAEPVCYKCGKKGYYASQWWSNNLRVTNVVGVVVELQSVDRRSIYHQRARIATVLATMFKTVSSRGATKL